MAQKTITRILEDIAMLLEIKGENPFKTRAYYNAAKTLSGITNLEELIKEKYRQWLITFKKSLSHHFDGTGSFSFD